jgi:SAM-dependent methyltransferase
MSWRAPNNPYDHANAARDWIARIESEGANPREQDIYPWLGEWVGHRAPARVLEIGCGQGICSDQLGWPAPAAGRAYVGVDPSRILIERARERYGRADRGFVLGDAYGLPFGEQEFDAAFSIAVWHLLGDKPRAARELARVLRQDGRFLLITANPASYDAWTEPYEDSIREGARFEGSLRLGDDSWSRETLYLHSLEEILGSLRAAGLRIEETRSFRFAEKAPQGLHLLIQGHA